MIELEKSVPYEEYKSGMRYTLTLNSGKLYFSELALQELHRKIGYFLDKKALIPCSGCGHSYPIEDMLPATSEPEAAAICLKCVERKKENELS